MDGILSSQQNLQIDSEKILSPSPLHEIRSPLSAAHMGLTLVRTELELGSMSVGEAIDLLKKIELKMIQTSEQLEKFKDRL
ncbi:MAG: hypothetical protein JWQ35_2537 [Bacteriovoracaceae bacterium]|nr:hypothetical protein [Bacteriovoracaceae bacterium]